jgi:hypothetical protein
MSVYLSLSTDRQQRRQSATAQADRQQHRQSAGRAQAERRQSAGRAQAERRQSAGRAQAERRQSAGRAQALFNNIQGAEKDWGKSIRKSRIALTVFPPLLSRYLSISPRHLAAQ